MPPLPTQFPISLRSWPASDSDSHKALPFLIQRINSEHGGFLDLDEDELREQIAREEAGASSANDDAASPEEGDEKPDRMKELMTAREEMLAQIEQAHQQAMFALDFVSLLISKDQPNQASLSISPFLRDHVGMGTLGADKVHASRTTDTQKIDNKRIAKGWKIQTLNRTADSILASATRLEKEIGLETAYWKQVLAISENGWAICRLPNEKHTLGVRFGFTEAGPTFKNSSMAALRREPDGSITLDQGVINLESQFVRIRVYDNDHQTGSSTIPSGISENAPIEERIQQARDAAFQAELWHELNREARTLHSLGVQCNNDSIIYPLSPKKTVILDLVNVDKYIAAPTGNDDAIAEGVSLTLHLLLSYAHRRNVFRRTDSNVPLTSFRRINSPYALLRSLITRANHQSTITNTHSLCDNISSILTAASYSPSPEYAITEPPLEIRSTLAPTEAVVVALFEHLHAQVTLNLTASCSLNMKIRTSLYPLTASNFNITLEPSEGTLQESCRAPGIVDQWHKSFDYILFVTACALASSFTSDSSKADVEKDISSDRLANTVPQWESTTRPHVIRLVPSGQPTGRRMRSKQASFSLLSIPSPDSADHLSRLKLRVDWEAVGGDSSDHTYADNHAQDSADVQDWKLSKGEGFYEWSISEGRSKVVGSGASGAKKSWTSDEPVKTLQEVIEIAGST